MVPSRLDGERQLLRTGLRQIAGRTLADVLKGDPPQQRLLRAFAEVCLAVEFAHSRGVVHRDLKPALIKRSETGQHTTSARNRS